MKHLSLRLLLRFVSLVPANPGFWLAHPAVPALLLGLLLPIGAQAQVVIADETDYSGPQAVVVSSGSTIANNTNDEVTVSSGATVTFRAVTSITLRPGFHAESGAKFYAMIGSTHDTDGDGIPDPWEVTHGLDPLNASDALNATSSGLTYLAEYLMGTNPSVSKTTDGGNTLGLKIHSPTAP